MKSFKKPIATKTKPRTVNKTAILDSDISHTLKPTHQKESERRHFKIKTKINLTIETKNKRASSNQPSVPSSKNINLHSTYYF